MRDSVLKTLKRELFLLAQYAALVAAAHLVAFCWIIANIPLGEGGEYAVTINIKEAWLNEYPYARTTWVVFVLLGVFRVMVACFLARGRGRDLA